ncbi:hypothetical protein EMCRGX_G028398 [Ephydatia muelleri]|eukprot:Em0020g295a
MPHGGGGHGGHFGGGGHHFGGGGHRHHFGGGGHHFGGGGGGHHHYSHYSYRYRSGYSSYIQRGSGGNGAVVLTCCCVLAAAIVLLVVPVTVTYKKNSTIISSTLSPSDARIVSVSSELCQGAKLNSPSSLTTGVTASLYLLQTKPRLAKDNFTLTYTKPKLALANSYEYLSFYLYPGTTYSLRACLGSGSSAVTYLVIKGTSTFNQWIDSGSSYLAYSNSALYLSALTSPCGVTNSSATLTFNSEDDYYFIFDNTNSASASVTYTVAFDRYEYVPSSGVIVDNCSTTLSATSCSLSFAYSSGHAVLVQTSSSPIGDVGANVDISVTCEARTWVYAAIEVSMFIAVTLCAIPILVWLYLAVMSGKAAVNAASVPVVPSAQSYPRAPATGPYPQAPTTQPYPQGPPQVWTPPQDPMAERLAAETASFPPTSPPMNELYPPAYSTAGLPPTRTVADPFDQPPPY